MAAEDWYRNREWNDQIETAFLTKLRRARDKSQYLRIQASYLQSTNPEVALHLLDDFFKLPANPEIAQAHLQVAEIQLALGNLKSALTSLRSALEAERLGNCHKTDAWVLFAELTLEHEIEPQYDEVLKLLREQQFVILPYQHFIRHAATAIISEKRGLFEAAKANAQQAIQVAKQDNSGLRSHPDVGLVDGEYPEIMQNLIAITGE